MTSKEDYLETGWFDRNADRRNPKAFINTDPAYFADECAAAITSGRLRPTPSDERSPIIGETGAAVTGSVSNQRTLAVGVGASEETDCAAPSRVLAFDQVVPPGNADVASLVERLRAFYDWLVRYMDFHPNSDAKCVDEAADALERCQAELVEVKEALTQIAALKWPEITGYHEYSTWGEATGNEYKHKMPIARDAHLVLQDAQAIACKALGE